MDETDETDESVGSRRRSWGALQPRVWKPPDLPQRPYPLLLPYTHPRLLGGRERELAELVQLVARPIAILGLHAPSGTGKSSLLGSGLVPILRAEGRAVAFDRHPHEPGLIHRLLGDLLTGAPIINTRCPVEVSLAVADIFSEIGRRSGEPPLLVLDQFEDLFRRPGMATSRAVLGPLLAASVQRRPGQDAPPCRWLLAYRRDAHGDVVSWLGDVLRDAAHVGTAKLDTLPDDLATSTRFHDWPLMPLGAPVASEEAFTLATKAFLAAIEAPLLLTDADGSSTYPWRFSDGGAERLARAFAEARIARPDAPLVPELQVVLSHLMEESAERWSWQLERSSLHDMDQGQILVVPSDLKAMIDGALEDHLKRALDAAFPPEDPWSPKTVSAKTVSAKTVPAKTVSAKTVSAKTVSAKTVSAKTVSAKTVPAKTRALLILRELASFSSSGSSAQAGDWTRAMGEAGEDILERLASPETRLVVASEADGVRTYALAHERLADLVVQVVEREGLNSGLSLDVQLLSVHRFVILQSELYRSGERLQSTSVSPVHARRIEEFADVLLWDEGRHQWWRACRERWRADRRRRMLRWAAGGLVLALVALAAWSWASRRTSRYVVVEQVARGAPVVAFQALAQLAGEPKVDAELLRRELARRPRPFDVLELGVGGGDPVARAEAVLRVTEIAMPLVWDGDPGDLSEDETVRLAGLLWALDTFPMRVSATARRAGDLREIVLTPLRAWRTPLPREVIDQVRIPEGTFEMESGSGTTSRRQTTVSGFSLSSHEVTVAAYRRLRPEHPGKPHLPVVGVTWHEAYVFAAWLGGRLPTEAEWEYAARATCPSTYCDRHGATSTADAVAWTLSNATDLDTGEPAPRPVGSLEPNPWGLFDMIGNVREMTADWWAPLLMGETIDPVGPSAGEVRTSRGSDVWGADQQRGDSPWDLRYPKLRSVRRGFRIAWF